MNTTTCRVIRFPDVRLWSQVARKYVDYMLTGDPRAAFYYLDYELMVFRLSEMPPALRQAIDKEYQRRGITKPVLFHKDR